MIYAFSGVSPLLLCRNSAFPLSIVLLFTPHKAVLSKEIRITYKKRLGYSFIKIYKWKLLSFKVVFLIKVERTLRVEPHRIATILLLLTTRKGNHTWKYANSISTCQNVTKSLSGQARHNRYGPSAPCERCGRGRRVSISWNLVIVMSVHIHMTPFMLETRVYLYSS